MIPFPDIHALAESLPFGWRTAATVALFFFLIWIWSQFELQAAQEQPRREENGGAPAKRSAADGG